jgi:hypothetical protein
MQSKEHRVADYLAEAIASNLPVDVFAQNRGGDFWYKVYLFTPYGVLKSDTGGEHLELKRDALRVIQRRALARVSLPSLMANWQRFGVWERSRPIGTELVRWWEACGVIRVVENAYRDARQMRAKARWN